MKVNVGIWVDPGVHEAIRAIAAAECKSTYAVILHMLQRGLDSYHEDRRLLADLGASLDVDAANAP